MRAGRQKKKLRLDKSQSLTPRERELLALFRVMTETDRRLLLSTAEKLVSSQAPSENRTP
jgi:DNA-binding CsgD family transcriptional regulator